MKVELENSGPSNRTINILLGDIGFTQDQWDSLSDDEKRDEIVNYIDGVDQPYWRLVSFEDEQP